MAQIEEFVLKLRDQFSPTLSKFNKGVKKSRTSVDKLKNSSLGLGSALGGIFAGVSIGALGREIVETTQRFDALEASLRFSAGSAMEGQKSMDFVRQTASDLKIDLLAASEGFNILSNATIGTGFSMAEARDLFSSVSAGLRVAQVSTEDTKGALRALGQIMSKGKLQAEELRLQLGDRLPGAFGIAARAMNVTTTRLDEMLKEGSLLAKDFLPKFSKELKKTFGAGVQKAVRTLNAKLTEGKNIFTDWKIAIGQGFTPVIVKSIDMLAEFNKHTGFLRLEVDRVTLSFALLKDQLSEYITVTTDAEGVSKAMAFGMKSLSFGPRLLSASLTSVLAIINAFKSEDIREGTFWASLSEFMDTFLSLPELMSNSFVAFFGELESLFSDISIIIDAFKGNVSSFGLLDAFSTAIDFLERDFNGFFSRVGKKFDELQNRRILFASKVPSVLLDAKPIFKSPLSSNIPITASGTTSKDGKKSKGLKSGIGEVRARAPKTFNINIESLIKEFDINAQTVTESTGKIKEKVTQVLLDAINDAQVIAR
ncbi:MAG: tape measure protein [Nitrosomonadaceae bacterium]